MTVSVAPKLALILSMLAVGACASVPDDARTAGHTFAFLRAGEPNILFATMTPSADDERTCFNVAWNDLPIPGPGEIAVMGELVPSAMERCGGRVLLVEEYLTDLQR